MKDKNELDASDNLFGNGGNAFLFWQPSGMICKCDGCRVKRKKCVDVMFDAMLQ